MYNTRPEARTANSTYKKVAVQCSADIFVLKLPAIVNLQTVIDSLKTDTTAQGYVFNFFTNPLQSQNGHFFANAPKTYVIFANI